jgi:hypothetical protein
MMPDNLGVEVVDGGEHPDPTLLGRLHQGGIGAPHHVRGLGQNGAVMVVGRAQRPPIRREQLIVAHQAQDAIAANRQAIMQAGPDFAVPFAGKWRGGEIGLDGGEQAGVIDRRLGATRLGGSAVGRAACPVKGRAR